jgi:hypothetical protein
MASTREISEQVEVELDRRSRLGVPAFAGGFLFLLSAIIIASVLSSAPTVGLLQGLEPAISGVADPAESPRAGEVRFISHHAFGLIAGSLIAAISIGVLVMILLLLLDATRFRRPRVWAPTRPLVLYGGIAVAVVSIAHQVVGAIETHKFVTGHVFTAHAVDQALTKGVPTQIVDYVALLAGLALAAGMVSTTINALRVGLIPRWMMILGVFTGLLIFLPIGGAELQVVPAFWMVMMGILYIGRWPNAEPPAWAAGEARPWPSAASMRAAKQGAVATAGGPDVAPVPAKPVQAGTSRKRRKGGSRG